MQFRLRTVWGVGILVGTIGTFAMVSLYCGLINHGHQGTAAESVALREEALQPPDVNNQQQLPVVDVHISAEVVDELKTVIDKMAASRSITPKRQGATLELYTEDSEYVPSLSPSFKFSSKESHVEVESNGVFVFLHSLT